MKLKLLFTSICLLFVFLGWTQTSHFSIQRQTLGSAGGSHRIEFGANNFLIQQSIGQRSAIGTHANDSFTLRQGFIQSNVFSVAATPEKPLLITLFPNPFADQFQLRFDETIVGAVQLLVFDLNGRVIHTETFNATQQHQVILNSLSSGVYLVQIQADDRTYSGRIQKL